MAAVKYDFKCPKCGNVVGYTPERLKKGRCPVADCEVELTLGQKEEIGSGIKKVSDERKLTKINSVISGKLRRK